MTSFALSNLPGPADSLQRARLYAPGGAAVTDLALVENPAGVFGGSVVLTPTPPDSPQPYNYEVRQVLAQSGAGFDASSEDTVSLGVYGYLQGGIWYAGATVSPPPRTGYRISAAQVQAILEYDTSITNLTPFIAAAEQLVDRVCANAPGEQQTGSPSFVGNPVVYSAQELAIIETWLAAHFVAIRDPLYASTSMGPASKSVIRTGGMNLAQTPYGQQAMLLDMNGGLAWLDKHISQGRRARVGVVYLGTRKDRWAYFPWRFYALGTG